MTLLEKIKNYKWFDSPNKLRVILEELYNSIGGGSGGGNQDLQSVLDNGNTSITPLIIDNGDGVTTTLNGNEIIIVDGDNIGRMVAGEFSFDTNIPQSGKTIVSGIGTSFISDDTLTSFIIFYPQITSGTNLNISFPEKPTGTYILATLDDIKKIDLSDRVYANNTAAITGGLTANDVYRTSTGELRIVV